VRFAGTGNLLTLRAKTVKAPLFVPQADCSSFTYKLGMPDQYRYYSLGAFLLGVVLTTAYNERSLYSQERADDANANQRRNSVTGFPAKNDLDSRKTNTAEGLHKKNFGYMKEGIEGCIGDTPLIKIKSLSEYTGCEILAKAEVIWNDCVTRE
jgi:cysteine synthase